MNSPKDLCLECGREWPYLLWGAKCHGRAVHQMSCTKCGRIIGYLTDDDYCAPEVLVCPDCMDKARALYNQG